METAVVIIVGVIFIIILLVLSPKVQEDIEKLHPKPKAEHTKITCSDFLKVLEENPDKELEITVKTYVGGEFGGYYQKDTKKVTGIEVTDDKVKITYQ